MGYHAWEAPSLVVITAEAGGALYTARQSCGACGAERNPLTGRMTKRGRGAACHSTAAPGDYSRGLERIRMDLDALEADGKGVDRDHPGRPVEREVPALPLAYKD